MKEIRKEKTIVVEEVTFVADDGKEFKVENGTTETKARLDCELHNRRLNEAKLRRDFEKLSFLYVGGVEDEERGAYIGQLLNDDDWETLCAFVKMEYGSGAELDVHKDRPQSFPCQGVYFSDSCCFGLWQIGETIVDDEGKSMRRYRPITPEEYLEYYTDRTLMLQKQIRKMKRSAPTKKETKS